ncbi:MAG: glycosyltransferase [Candidatus Omnitrophica bacterium]|nr:glycosyltransferase [Candidatus Omnitrophota bacterium]
MKIAVIYDKFREDVLGEYYKRALERAGHTVEHFWLKDSVCIKPEYDLYFRVDDGDYKFDIPHAKLKPGIFYASDVHLKKPFRKISKVVPLYDMVFCAQYDGCQALKRKFPEKVAWLPHAADLEFHKDLGIARDLDIGFVGNDGSVPRKFFLQELRERYPNSFIGNAPSSKINEIYSRSKIVFNYSIKNDINMRMFEALMSGAMLLTNFLEDKGFAQLFEDRKNLVLYKNPKELFELLEYYLGHEGERRAIARAGWELAKERFTYDKRVEEILAYIKRGKA